MTTFQDDVKLFF